MTATPWERFDYGPWDDDMVVPQTPPDEATRAARDLPRTLRPVTGEGVLQRPAYDPAVNHRRLGMRLSEPQFTDARKGEAWYTARHRALWQVLAAVAGSEWAGHLMLRGSMLLRTWYGDAAREPGDLDFVVVPDTWRIDDERTDTMLDGIARAAEARTREAGCPVRIDAAGAVSDEIWTYDRVPGRRLVLPWTAEDDDTPAGTVQLDFVFNEKLPDPPVPGGDGTDLMTASRELSLAWKLLWLVTDHHPEAKDLYDAVLLAEDPGTNLPYELLHRILLAEGEPCDLHYILVQAAEADWDEYHKDRPALSDTGMGYLSRLAIALAPVFAPDEEGVYAPLAAVFAELTSMVRAERDEGGAEAVEAWFTRRTLPSVCAVVVARELLGRTQCTLQEAADLLVTFRDTRWGRESHPYLDGWHGNAHETARRLEAAEAAATVQ
ncbi:nucleotidyl transferase AbiEii/AbiGii toxin family protein [Streptomyces sp. NPDC053048]|uniref:nucleotidyl transferase AbiEii/AbiGii toxin family protein n=1 Tax=Streptomyces sp. NPDC053048 TaxID=3365694 RepID=UPI0037D69421